jgi:hypothetical protein
MNFPVFSQLAGKFSGFKKGAFEIVHPVVAGAKLEHERRPLDEGGPVRINAVEPLRQP